MCVLIKFILLWGRTPEIEQAQKMISVVTLEATLLSYLYPAI